jgi:site-specific DNA-methyltransferase (adenine-specific)
MCAAATCRHPRLVVTSPPYCLGIVEDGYVDYEDYRGYLAAADCWARELYRVLPPDGRLALNVPIDIARCGRFPVASDWLHILIKAGFRYRSTIVWKEGNISQSTARGSIDSPSAINLICPAEAVLVVHKDDWNLNRSEPSDLTHAEWLEWTLACWSFAGESTARVGYPAPFPIELPRRLIKLLSFPGDLVLDPFVGSGTTALAALTLGRRFYGCDINPLAVERARIRVAGATRGDSRPRSNHLEALP